MSSAVLISEGQNHLVEVFEEDCFPAAVSSQKNSQGEGRGSGASPAHQSALGGGGSLAVID